MKAITAISRRLSAIAMAMCFFMAQSAIASDLVHALIIELNDGNAITYFLPDKPEVTFEGKDLNIKTRYVEAQYEISQIQDFHFIEKEYESGINDIYESTEGKVYFTWIDKSTIEIHGVTPDSHLLLADISGKLYPVSPQSGMDSVIISVADLPDGVYILSINNLHTIKFFKK